MYKYAENDLYTYTNTRVITPFPFSNIFLTNDCLLIVNSAKYFRVISALFLRVILRELITIGVLKIGDDYAKNNSVIANCIKIRILMIGNKLDERSLSLCCSYSF